MPPASRTSTSAAGTPSSAKLAADSVTEDSGAEISGAEIAGAGQRSAGMALNGKIVSRTRVVALTQAVTINSLVCVDCWHHAYANRCLWNPIRHTERPTLRKVYVTGASA